MEDTHVIESCQLCNVKVRLLKEKAAAARCPKCRGPLGDPKVDQACGGCGAVNRVIRSKLAQAKCGRCKEPLFKGELPPALVMAEAQQLVGAILADPKLAGRAQPPRDLVEATDLLKAMPQAIAEWAAAAPPGADRDRLALISGRCRSVVPRLRPLCYPQPAVLLNERFVSHFLLDEQFEALRRHALAWESLKAIRRQDKGAGAARSEIAPAGAVFEALVNRLHKTDWEDMAGDRTRRLALADRLFAELSKVVESWLLRPYKLEAMTKSGMARLGELPGGADALARHEAALREDVAAFFALATTVVARGVVHHGLGKDPREVWAGLAGPLRGTVMAAAS